VEIERRAQLDPQFRTFFECVVSDLHSHYSVVSSPTGLHLQSCLEAGFEIIVAYVNVRIAGRIANLPEKKTSMSIHHEYKSIKHEIALLIQ